MSRTNDLRGLQTEQESDQEQDQVLAEVNPNVRGAENAGTFELTISRNGKIVAGLVANPKIFSTGTSGWYANGQAEVNGRKIMINCNVSNCGTKSDAAKASDAAKKLAAAIKMVEAAQRRASK